MKKLKKCLLNIAYSLSRLDLKVTEVRYNIQHVIVHRRKPKKMSKKQYEAFEQYINEQRKKGG